MQDEVAPALGGPIQAGVDRERAQAIGLLGAEGVIGLFDWIVVDSPPLLPLADTTVWARLSDGVLLVTREGKTEKKQLQRGLDAVKNLPLLGVVLNGCSHSDQKNYYQRYAPK